MNYQPPYTITPAIVNRVAAISETICRYTVPGREESDAAAAPGESHPYYSCFAGYRE